MYVLHERDGALSRRQNGSKMTSDESKIIRLRRYKNGAITSVGVNVII